jgi:hypothetical protein
MARASTSHCDAHWQIHQVGWTMNRRVADGDLQRAGSLGVTQYYAKASIPLSPAGRMSGRALLKRGYVTQALIDSTAVLFCFLFVLSVALSIPLALFLLLVARF